MAVVPTVDVVTNPDVNGDDSLNSYAGKAVCSAMPTGTYHSYQVEPLTDRETRFDFVATETKLTDRFNPFYYNSIDGGNA